MRQGNCKETAWERHRMCESGFRLLEEGRPFSVATTSSLALWSRQFAIQWLLRRVSQQIKQPERDANHSRPRSVQIYCVKLYGHSFSVSSHGVFWQAVLPSKRSLHEVFSVTAEYPTCFVFETTEPTFYVMCFLLWGFIKIVRRFMFGLHRPTINVVYTNIKRSFPTFKNGQRYQNSHTL
jgi:hypothetical protein